MGWIIIIFLSIIAVLIYALYNMNNKVSALENICLQYAEGITFIRDISVELLNETERIRAKELFEKDDEVGIIFETMHQLIVKYNDLITNIIPKENAKDEE